MLNIFKARKSSLALLVLSVVIFARCSKDEINSIEPDMDPVEANHAMGDYDVILTPRDKTLDDLARKLAASLDKKEVRSFIKSEALKKFDGDFDVLYSQIKDKDIAGKKLKEHVNQSNKAESNGKSFEELASKEPKLNISVPVNIDKWDTENFTPLVAVVAISSDEKTTKFVKAYDSKGNVHWLDYKNAPDYPVVAVGLNERVEVDANGNVTKINKYPTLSSTNKDGKNASFCVDCDQQLEPVDDGGGGGGSYSPPPTTSYTCRLDNRWEYMKGMWFSDVSYYEAWARGAPEVVVWIKSPLLNFQTSTDQSYLYKAMFEPSKRDDVNGKWWNLDNNLFAWKTAEVGTTMGFYFYEEDEGGTGQKIDLSLSYKKDGVEATAKTTILIGSSDDHIGLKPVAFDPCPGEGYYSVGGGTAEFRFKLENR